MDTFPPPSINSGKEEIKVFPILLLEIFFQFIIGPKKKLLHLIYFATAGVSGQQLHYWKTFVLVFFLAALGSLVLAKVSSSQFASQPHFLYSGKHLGKESEWLLSPL